MIALSALNLTLPARHLAKRCGDCL